MILSHILNYVYSNVFTAFEEKEGEKEIHKNEREWKRRDAKLEREKEEFKRSGMKRRHEQIKERKIE